MSRQNNDQGENQPDPSRKFSQTQKGARESTPVGEEHRLDPTRYGDWEKNGIAVDF